MMAKYGPKIRSMAGRIFFPHRLGMGSEDVEQELYLALVKLTRAHYVSHRELPPPALVHCCLKRRLHGLMNSSTTEKRKLLGDTVNEYRQGDAAEPVPITSILADDSPNADATLEQDDLEAACTALTAVVRDQMTPARFGVLYLRYVEDMSNSTIGGAVGMQPYQVKHRVYKAKERAVSVLQALGIDTWEQAADWLPENAYAS